MQHRTLRRPALAALRAAVAFGAGATVLAGLGACTGNTPRVYGEYHDISPKVALPLGERVPRHLTVELARPANVAVFLVTPGAPSRLLFPPDSLQGQYIEAGAHLVETSLARASASDTSRLLRNPTQPNDRGGYGGRNGRQGGMGGGFPRDTFPAGLGYNTHGFLLIYASQQPLPYATLTSRVAGVSVPIEDSDALNTVTKLIRSTTRTIGPWAAFATDYPP